MKLTSTIARQNRKSRRPLAQVCFAALVVVLLATTVGSSSAAAQDEEPESTAENPTMVAAYAAEYGVSNAEAIHRMDQQEALGARVTEIAQIENARLAGYGIVHDPDFGGWVLLTGTSSASAAATAIGGTDIEIRLGADFTLTELEAGISSYMADLDASARASVTSTDIDQEANRLVVGVDEQTSGAAANMSAQSATAASAIPIDFVTQPRPQTQRIIRGGNGLSTCTSAFMVRGTSGPYAGLDGMLTAGHCPNTQFDGNVALPFAGETAGLGITDGQWHLRPENPTHEIRDDFRCGTSGRIFCDVRGKTPRQSANGKFVCLTGMNSGISCGTVESNVFAPNYVECPPLGCANRYLKIEGLFLHTCFGDSGGPVWFNRKAYGVISGVSSSNPSNCFIDVLHTVVAPINMVENALGVELATN